MGWVSVDMPSTSDSTSKQHYLLDVLLSPAGIFMLFCLLMPPMLEFMLPMDKPLPIGVEYWFAMPVCIWLSIGMAVVNFTQSNKKAVKTLSKAETWIASWYLINGCFFTSMMDVFAGFFQR